MRARVQIRNLEVQCPRCVKAIGAATTLTVSVVSIESTALAVSGSATVVPLRTRRKIAPSRTRLAASQVAKLAMVLVEGSISLKLAGICNELPKSLILFISAQDS